MIAVGIDPGREGGIVALNKNGEPILKEIMPKDPLQLHDMLKDFKDLREPTLIFLEEAHPRPGNGIKSTFSFGYHNGQLDVCLRFLGIPYELVSPHVWAKSMHAGCRGETTKQKSQQAVERLFPGISLPRSTARALKMHEGVMEALLIAEYGRRKLMEWKTR